MMNTTQTTNTAIGRTVTDTADTGITGALEYITEDSWAGIRQADGRLDEVPVERLQDVATGLALV